MPLKLVQRASPLSYRIKSRIHANNLEVIKLPKKEHAHNSEAVFYKMYARLLLLFHVRSGRCHITHEYYGYAHALGLHITHKHTPLVDTITN